MTLFHAAFECQSALRFHSPGLPIESCVGAKGRVTILHQHTRFANRVNGSNVDFDQIA